MKLLFRNRLFLAVLLGHFVLDIFNSSGPVVVTFLSVPMALSAAQIGLTLGTYQLTSALAQPLFGWLADKIGSRWLGPGSVAWTIGFLTLSIYVALQTNDFVLFMVFYIIASFGSSAFHPLGIKHAAHEAANRAAMGTAIFFLFGQSGLATGPILAGFILENVGPIGIYLWALATIPPLIFMLYAMRHAYGELPLLHQDPSFSADHVKKTIRWGAIILLAVLVGLRSWTVIGTVSFLPKMFQDMGWSPTAYGSITGTYWMSSAIFGVLAGHWADRLGRRQIVFVTLGIGSISLYFLPLNSGWFAFPLAIMSGGLLGASHSILVVMAQSLLPGGDAFASGVTLGYLFGVGAIAAWGIGTLADVWGLNLVIQASSGLTLTAALLALFLPATRDILQPQAEGVLA